MSLNVWLVLAFAAGICSTLQSSANGSLSRSLGTSAAVTVNTLVFLVLCVPYLFYSYSAGEINLSRAAETRWTDYLGGVFGFGVVLFLTLCFPRLGALWTVVLLVLGQSITAIVVDHFSLYGMPQAALSPHRILAVGFIIAGIFLLRK